MDTQATELPRLDLSADRTALIAAIGAQHVELTITDGESAYTVILDRRDARGLAHGLLLATQPDIWG